MNLKKINLLVAFILFFGWCSLKAEPIEDNSFLVEEAYNQEPGVVQFINVWQKPTKTNDWTFTFINEVPVISQAHQFSYELPYSNNSSNNKSQLKDVKLNYRYEVARSEMVTSTVRLSVTLPTGNYKDGFGSGAYGYETALISSLKISDLWVQHWNFGGGIVPNSKNVSEDKADISRYFFGLSQVLLMTDNLNFMFELTGSQSQAIVSNGVTSWEQELIVSPSVRYGIDYKGWQFVPGIALPTGFGASAGQNQQLGYLSIEGKMW